MATRSAERLDLVGATNAERRATSAWHKRSAAPKTGQVGRLTDSPSELEPPVLDTSWATARATRV
jgi:hypothetical protein